ncbi:hypothetical protein EDC04DRAFT_2603659 [Pisolithus marmoratus]|nr:hypothetical protein EDC04DRAFT_2603659 [Pisolithus marmoratus]
MARTKQSASKATGGSAPRVVTRGTVYPIPHFNLWLLTLDSSLVLQKKAKAKAASNKPSPKIPVQANSMVETCGCLIVSGQSMDMVKGPDVKFICLTCHLQQNKKHPKPYFGFYSKGEPTLSTPPTIPRSFQHAIISQVVPLPIALLHLHLQGLDQAVGLSQVAMLHSFLQAYFPQGDYKFSKLPFNLGTPESMDEYDKKASHLANTLSAYSKVVVFLKTHSDEERHGILCVWLWVTDPQSFKEVKEVVQQFTPKSMLLFDAQHLQLVFTVPYLHSLLDSTIIQGFPVSSAARVALNDYGMLGRHSNIILLICQEGGLVVKKFLWDDKHLTKLKLNFNIISTTVAICFGYNCKPPDWNGVQQRKLSPLSANILTVEKTWDLMGSLFHQVMNIFHP